MPRPRRFQSRFDDADADPLAGMANLADVMLVFACGLLSALVLGKIGEKIDAKAPADARGGVSLEQGRELPDLARGQGGGVSGYEAVGKVYRDPKSGKLVMVGE